MTSESQLSTQFGYKYWLYGPVRALNRSLVNDDFLETNFTTFIFKILLQLFIESKQKIDFF